MSSNISGHCVTHKLAIHVTNLVLGALAVLMCFSACFSYTYVGNSVGSRYLPTLQRLPWLTLWSQVESLPPTCMGLGLSSYYSGLCGFPVTTVGVYADNYDKVDPTTGVHACPPAAGPQNPSPQAIQIMQLGLDSCDALNRCVYSGNVCLGFSMMSILASIACVYSFWQRFKGGSPNSAMMAFVSSLVLFLLSAITFFSFYSCGNWMRYIAQESNDLKNVVRLATGQPSNNIVLTLGAGGAGVCVMLVWLFSIFMSVSNYCVGLKDDPGNALNGPLAEGDHAQAQASPNPVAGVGVGVTVEHKPRVDASKLDI